MKFYFHEDAELEFGKAIEYYEGCQTGLGLEYAQEIYAAIKRIIQYPEAWPPFSKKNETLPCKPFSILNHLSSEVRFT